jgi:hypothetical protein
MSGVIAEFWALIKGDSSQLQGELAKVKTSVIGQTALFAGAAVAGVYAFKQIAGAISPVIDAFLDLSKGAMDYGLQVHDMSLITGDSAEKTSMLVQAADDARISYDQLTTAMRMAVKNGIDPSLEGMEKLADQYNSISDPIERSTFLIDTFGKSGLQMGKLMEMGSHGIKMSADEAKRLGLVLSVDMVNAAQDYQRALDGMEDANKGLKTTIGNQLLPLFTKLVNNINENVGADLNLYNQVNDVTDAYKAGIITQEEYNGFIENTGVTYEYVTDKVRNYNQALYDGMNITQEDLKYTDRWAIKLGEVGDEAEKAKTAVELLNATPINLGGEAESEIKKIEFLQAGGQIIEDFKKRLEEAYNASGGTPQGLQDYKTGLQDIIAMQDVVAIDLGDMTEWEGIVDIREKLGLKTYEDADKLLHSMRGQMLLLDGMVVHNDIFTTHHIITKREEWNWQGASGGYIGGFAEGGYAGGSYLVGERGPEVVTPSSQGYVAPNETATIKLDEGSMRVLAKYITDGMAMARA